MPAKLAMAATLAYDHGSVRTSLSALLDAGTFFHLVRRPSYAGTLSRLAACLDARPEERVLDVGCGTGMCTGVVPGHYVGIDTHVPYLRVARRGRERRAGFARMSGTAFGFLDGAFDKAVVVNVVHHLDDAAVDGLLQGLRRVVRGPVVVLDAAPEIANRFERFLLDHDRGNHVRPVAALRALLARRYRVAHEESFHNALHTIPQAMFRLVPP